MSAIRAEVYRRANARYPDPGVGKDVQYRNPGSGGTDEPMLITDPNTGEIYRVGGARSANQVRALKPSKIQQEQPAPKKPQSSAPKEKTMGPLRKAGNMIKQGGKKLLDMDEAYANKVGQSIDPRKQPFAEMTRAVPLRHLSQGSADSQIEKMALAGLTAGVGTANIASRYALPAGGVTLAGKALYDLTTQFGGVADQPQPNELTLQ